MCVVHKVRYIDIELCMLRCPFSGSNIQALFFSLKAVIEIKKGFSTQRLLHMPVI